MKREPKLNVLLSQLPGAEFGATSQGCTAAQRDAANRSGSATSGELGRGSASEEWPPSLKTRGRSWRSDTQRGRGVRQAEAGEVRQKMKDENGRKTWAEGRMKAKTNSQSPAAPARRL